MALEQEIQAIQRFTQVYYDTYANLPTTNVRVQSLGYATDRLILYRWSGSVWESLSVHSSSGLASAIPTASELPDGSLYYETDTAILKQVQSASWVSILQEGKMRDWSAGDDLNISSDGVVSGNQTTYTKKKEIALASGGIIRVKFDLCRQGAGGIAYGRIYRNGSPVGAEQSEAGLSFVTQSEDISGWADQDLLQLYLKISDAAYTYEGRYLRLYGDSFHLHTEL